MGSLSKAGVVLSVAFVLLLLALICELYYLLWWKKRNPSIPSPSDPNSTTRSFFFLKLRHNQHPLPSSPVLNSPPSQALSGNPRKGSCLQLCRDEEAALPECVLRENPHRILFTIVEETKEDLESEDGVIGSTSLRSLILAVETPFLTPLSSPSTFATSPLTPCTSGMDYHFFGRLSCSSAEAQFNRMRTSPPPKLKFLRDAEFKLYWKRLMDERERETALAWKAIQQQQNSG